MSFEWLKQFQREIAKAPDYAEKTLAQYRLGMRAQGSIVGVRIVVDSRGCIPCRLLNPQAIYHPDDAPRLPLTECSRGAGCQCVYRPVMSYEIDPDGQRRNDI